MWRFKVSFFGKRKVAAKSRRKRVKQSYGYARKTKRTYAPRKKRRTARVRYW